MLPINNGDTSPCSNISSNCVIWQGPDIPCIGLCHGDTVSDVIAKLAEKLCELLDQTTTAEPDLTGLDLLCTLPNGQTAPDTIAETIQLIVDYVCDISKTPDYVLPTINLPACLYYTPEGSVDQVTALPLDEYAELLATEICDILSTISVIQANILDHESRLVILENCVLPCASGPADQSVLSDCLFPGVSTTHSDMILALEEAHCNLENAVGSPALISLAINTSNCITGSTSVLSGTGTYGSLSDWVATPSTLSHAVQNAWVVICDMYDAIQTIQANCCPGACDSIIYAFTASLNKTNDGVPTGVTAVFTSSSVPATYNDCTGSSTLTVTDGNGASTTTTFSIASLQSSASGLFVSLSGLYLYDGFTLVADFCTTDGVNTCSETVTTTVSSEIPCPSNMTQTASTTTIDVTFNNWIGNTAIYVVKATDVSTGIVVDSNTITTPGLAVFTQLTGLTASTTYLISIEVSIGGRTRICDFPSNITTGEPAVTTNYYVRSCSSPGDMIVVGYSSGTLTIGQAVLLSFDNGTDCWEIVSTTTNPSTTTVLYAFTDCTSCGSACLSYTIQSNDVNNDGDVNYTDCNGNAASQAVVGITNFTICSQEYPFLSGVSGAANITLNGPCV